MAAKAAAGPAGEEPSSTPPTAFYCPISLELMTDPVTLSSGITYDRDSIQGWLAAGHQTCPVTRQPLLLHDPFLVPNHTLLRIIQAWCHSHSQSQVAGRPPTDRLGAGHTRLGHLCTDALLALGLVEHPPQCGELIIPHAQLAPLLISLLAHYSISSCLGDPLSRNTCQEALSTLCSLPLPSHHLSFLSHSHVLQCLVHFLHSSYPHHHPLPHDSCSSAHSSFLLAKLISQNPSPRSFLRSLPLHCVSSIAGGLALFLKLHSPPADLAKGILLSLTLLCKSSRTALLSFPEATFTAMAHAGLEQLLHSARQDSSSDTSLVSENALSLLEALASCAEGRAAIASQAFAVPTVTKLLRRSASEAAVESAVAVLWKLCRYSSEERVRRQAMAACVPSKLVLLLQAGHCSNRAKAKAGALVRLLIGDAKASRH